MTSCPCCSGDGLDTYCGAIIAGAPAPTAEALMRSRYSAFVLGDLDYIEATHAPEVRGDFNRSAAESVANDAQVAGPGSTGHHRRRR